MERLYIVSNESIFEKNGNFFCDNIDLKSTPEELSKKFKVKLIGRKSHKKRSHKIKLKNLKTFDSIFSFLLEICKSVKKNSKYLLISISPFTFFALIVLRIFGKIPYVYLRSDGYKEYKIILGSIGTVIYHMMFSITSKYSNLISCRKEILRKKEGKIIYPSQIDNYWFRNLKKNKFKKFKLLYVGRIRKEKGIFSLINLIKNKKNIFLTIVGAEDSEIYNINEKNIFVNKIEKNKNNLINYYDKNNIFVLPSFTEGHPMVLLEALARRRPVIIFDEIKHIVGSKKGIFICKRNFKSFFKTIKYIKKNLVIINESLKNNELPTKKNFINDLTKILKTK